MQAVHCRNVHQRFRSGSGLGLSHARGWMLVVGLLLLAATGGHAEPVLPSAGAGWRAEDSLRAELVYPEHRQLLEPMLWTPQAFDVRLLPLKTGEGDADALLAFPSPHAVEGSDELATVYLDAYLLTEGDGQLRAGPAIVLLPETSRRRTATLALARGLRASGIHAFVLQPPGYARRGGRGVSREPQIFLARSRQAVADARRAADAVRALPGLAGQPVSVGGISLGGFLTQLTAQLDDSFAGTFILLAGGDLHTVMVSGQKDAARYRQAFEAAGLKGPALREFLFQLEPLRGADRLNPATTWLYAGRYDTVVPPASSDAVARAVGLTGDHYVRLPADHYSGVLLLPGIVRHMARQIRRTADQPEGNAPSASD